MELAEELERMADLAAEHAVDGEELAGIVVAEASPGERVYLCAFEGPDSRAWLALDAAGTPVEERTRVREAVSIAVLCEVAEESAGGGDLAELRAQLVSLRVTENPPGIAEAEEAALALEATVGAPPHVATPARLDEVGAATRRLERALGGGGSPFAESLKGAVAVVDGLMREVEAGYKRELG